VRAFGFPPLQVPAHITVTPKIRLVRADALPPTSFWNVNQVSRGLAPRRTSEQVLAPGDPQVMCG